MTKEIKKEARTAIRSVSPHPVPVTIVLIVLILLLSFLSLRVDGTWDVLMTLSDALEQGTAVELESLLTSSSGSGVSSLLSLALSVMILMLDTGYTIYCLHAASGEETALGNLFDSFGCFFRIIWFDILHAAILYLWSCIYTLAASVLLMLTGWVIGYLLLLPLLVPAVCAVYAYRQGIYLLVESARTDTPKPAVLCLRESRTLMQGHKGELFRLDLSFLGWYLLMVLVPPTAIWVMPYTSVSYACFFRRLHPAAPQSEIELDDGDLPF